MSYRDRKVSVLTKREHYAADHALVVRSRDDDSETTVQIRRVVPSGSTEELQIEIAIIKFGEKRNTNSYGSIVCSPEIADQIAKACTTLVKPSLRP